MKIFFNKPYCSGSESFHVRRVLRSSHWAGDGDYTRLCADFFAANLGVKKALLTHSCTAALEMIPLILGWGEGDEVIMPSFTFVSTANAFVLRGMTPVFVDIRPDTFNIDEARIEAAITPKTKAIVVVHYAGVPCEMHVICRIARKYNLIVVEDAAQALFSKLNGKCLGTWGDFAAVSFHETKNFTSGEGGALFINDAAHDLPPVIQTS